MNSYTVAADKLKHEMRHLERILDHDSDDLGLAVMQAKRVRSASTVLVRALARHRDSLQPTKEGTSE